MPNKVVHSNSRFIEVQEDYASQQSSSGGGGSVVTPSALTKVDDTNVTLSLGGTPSAALLQAVNLTLGWTGALAASRGGADAWVDYTGTSTIVGWSSFTTQSIRYQLGYKSCHIVVFLSGTSDSTALTFTLPVALGASAIAANVFLNWGQNNGVQATKAASITGSTVTVGNSPVSTATAWTASGTKSVTINIVYETD